MGKGREKKRAETSRFQPFKKWYHLDLNQGHTDFQSVALPTELWYLKNGLQK